MREKGVLLPILVRPVAGRNNEFEIVAGERRWRAAQMAKLHDVPVVVREMTDSESLELAIIENVQRADLNAVEEAARLSGTDRALLPIPRRSWPQEVGKSRSHIANTLRLLKLPDAVRAMVRDGRLTAGHARTLIGLPDAEQRARDIVEGGLNVRQAEQRSGNKAAKHGKAPAPAEKDADTRALEASLVNVLGLKVRDCRQGREGRRDPHRLQDAGTARRRHPPSQQACVRPCG